jgi:hypothetical protein
MLSQSKEKNILGIIQNLQFGLIRGGYERAHHLNMRCARSVDMRQEEELMGKVASEVPTNAETREAIRKQHELESKTN